MAKSKKTPTKKSNGASNGASNGHKAEPRSAKQGGHVPAARYAKDPKSVVARLKEKAQSAGEQAANAIVRAEKAGVKDSHTKKLADGLKHFESAMKALS